jgi:hypothetical protein
MLFDAIECQDSFNVKWKILIHNTSKTCESIFPNGVHPEKSPSLEQNGQRPRPFVWITPVQISQTGMTVLHLFSGLFPWNLLSIM